MTLVINATFHGYVVHASDRLISKQKSLKSQYTEHDLHSNKTVVVVGYNCCLIIGYCNIAYLDGKPTDQRIAELITQIPDLTNLLMQPWYYGPELHYREITTRLTRGIFESYKRLPRQYKNYNVTVDGIGFQFTRKYPRRISFRLEVDEFRPRFTEIPQPDDYPARPQRITAMGAVDNSIWADLCATASSTPFESVDQFRDLLMDAVARTGAISSSVGEDVIGVVYTPRENGVEVNKVSVHFRPAEHGKYQHSVARRLGSQKPSDAPSVETPWIVSQRMLYGPGFITNGGFSPFEIGTDSSVSLTTLEVTGVPESMRKKGDYYFASIPRKPPP